MEVERSTLNIILDKNLLYPPHSSLLSSSHRKCSIKKVFLKIPQYSQENICIGVFFNSVADLQVCNFSKKRLQHRCLPVNIAKFLRTLILKNICQRLPRFIIECKEFFTDMNSKDWDGASRLSWWCGKYLCLWNQVIRKLIGTAYLYKYLATLAFFTIYNKIEVIVPF